VLLQREGDAASLAEGHKLLHEAHQLLEGVINEERAAQKK
jgi:hypothetical protein